MPPPSPSPLVVLTIWTALLLYAAGEYGRMRRPAAAWARPVWLLGAVAYLAHVAAAFATHHGWSHAAALPTRRRVPRRCWASRGAAGCG